VRRLGRWLADAVMATGTAMVVNPALPHLPVIEAAWPGRCIFCSLEPGHGRHGSAGLALAVALGRRP
jgi:hypothetical protein